MTISLNQEGVCGWASLRDSVAGMLDLGGASTQIAFQPVNPAGVIAQDGFSWQYPCMAYAQRNYLYAHTYHCLVDSLMTEQLTVLPS